MKKSQQDKFIHELIIGFPYKVKKCLKQWLKDGNNINQPFYTGSCILHYAVDDRKHHLVLNICFLFYFNIQTSI